MSFPLRDGRIHCKAGCVLGRFGMSVRIFVLALVLLVGWNAAAQERIRLFKLVSTKDEVVIGLTPGEMRQLGTGPELDLLAKRLAAEGQMTVWQYAVRKDGAGNLQQAPLRRIAIFRNDAVRIEPYTTPLPVMAPSP
jgi:hypothetical protein